MQLKIPHATTKTRHSQINKYSKKKIWNHKHLEEGRVDNLIVSFWQTYFGSDSKHAKAKSKNKQMNTSD